MALAQDTPRGAMANPYELVAPVALGTVIYNGSIVVQDVTGGAHTAGQAFAATLNANNRVMGIATQGVTGGAADGAVTVDLIRCRPVWLTNSGANPVTAAMIGQQAYLEDDEKVRCLVGGGVNVPVGMILDVDATEGVLVLVGFGQPIESAPGNLAVGGNLAVTGDITGTGATVVSTTTGNLTLDSPDGDVIAELGDAAGAEYFKVQDSAHANVFDVGSTGIVRVKEGQRLDTLAAGALNLGTTTATSVNVGRAGQATNVKGTLTVDQAATFTLAADFDAGVTVAAGQAITGDGALTLGVVAGAFDLSLKLGDNAGVQKLSVKDSDSVEVAYISSDGLIYSTPAQGVNVGYKNAAITEPPTDGELAALFPALNTIGAGGLVGVTNTGGAGKSYLCLKCTGANVWKVIEVA